MSIPLHGSSTPPTTSSARPSHCSEYAYIGARCDRRYTIDEPTVLFLAERVGELLRLTGERCREKIEALEGAAVGG